MQLLKDNDASLEPLAGKMVAVLGYGNQGQAQALNMRDSGVQAIGWRLSSSAPCNIR